MTLTETKLPQPWLDDERPSLRRMLDNMPTVLKAIDSIPENILSLGERRLELKIRGADSEKKFPRQLGLVKIAFWEDYRHALAERRTMRQDAWLHGICHKSWFNENVLNNPYHLSWLITPPTDEILLQKELLGIGMKRLREVMEADIFITKTFTTTHGNKKTEKQINVPLIKEMHAIIKTLQDRVHGAVIQRQQIEARTQSLNVTKNLNPTLSSPDLTLDQLEAFEKKINQIKGTLESSTPALIEAAPPSETEDVED